MSARDDAIAAWYDVLCRGDAITWGEFAGSATASSTPIGAADVQRARPAPPTHLGDSGAQLEVIRRIVTGGDLVDLPELAARIVRTAAIGRGRVDTPVPWPQGRDTLRDPGALAPEQLPAVEVLRVVVPVLGDLLDRLDEDATSSVGAASAARGWPEPSSSGQRLGARLLGLRTRITGRTFQLHGPPLACRLIRRHLLAAGLREGRGRAEHLVVAQPLETAMFDLWCARVRRGAALGWPRWWHTVLSGDDLPPRLDPAALLARLAGEIPARRLHLVVGGSTDRLVERSAQALGISVPQDVIGTLPSWSLVDLERRLNRLWAQREVEERSRGCARLEDLIPGDSETAPAAVPTAAADGARRTAETVLTRVRGQVSRAGYAVLGDLDQIGALVPAAEVPAPTPADTVDAGIEAIRAGWTALAGPSSPRRIVDQEVI